MGIVKWLWWREGMCVESGQGEQTWQRDSLSRDTEIREGIFEFEKWKESPWVCRTEGKEEGATGDDQEMSIGQGCRILWKVFVLRPKISGELLRGFFKLLLCMMTFVFKMITLAALWKIEWIETRLDAGD